MSAAKLSSTAKHCGPVRLPLQDCSAIQPASDQDLIFVPDNPVGRNSKHSRRDSVSAFGKGNQNSSDARQITKADFRLLNNGAWIDNNYFVARKHFTSGRSLGAGVFR